MCKSDGHGHVHIHFIKFHSQILYRYWLIALHYTCLDTGKIFKLCDDIAAVSMLKKLVKFLNSAKRVNSCQSDNKAKVFCYGQKFLIYVFLETKHNMVLHSEHATVYPKKYAHGFVVLCFVVVMQSFIMKSHEVFIHIHQGCFAGTGAIVRLPQCQWSKPGGYGKISQCITTTKHSKAKTVCIFLGIYCKHNGNYSYD